jgi:drug/metabolite transporter (DMT)-like permease
MAYILMVFILLMVAAGQTLLKKGVQAGQARGKSRIASLFHPYVIAAFILVGASPLLYVRVVASLGLSNAFGLNALNYPLIFILSRLFLSEKSNSWHWSGLTLITLGVFIWSL